MAKIIFFMRYVVDQLNNSYKVHSEGQAYSKCPTSPAFHDFFPQQNAQAGRNQKLREAVGS